MCKGRGRGTYEVRGAGVDLDGEVLVVPEHERDGVCPAGGEVSKGLNADSAREEWMGCIYESGSTSARVTKSRPEAGVIPRAGYRVQQEQCEIGPQNDGARSGCR